MTTTKTILNEDAFKTTFNKGFFFHFIFSSINKDNFSNVLKYVCT